MFKCKVCGRRFRLLAKNRYEVVRIPTSLKALVEEKVYFNAFDCPRCGCQNILGVVEKKKVNDMPQAEGEIHCTYTDSEIAESFINDVEAVEDLLPKAESEVQDDAVQSET